MYRWFVRRFPNGGSYADVHRALSGEGYLDWANSLVEYAWSRWLDEESFARQDISAMDSLVSAQSHHGNSEHIACADDNVHLGCAGDNVKIASVGYASQIASAGYCARIGSAGYNTHIGCSGDRARVAVAGNSTRVSCAGDGSRIASAGMRVRISTLGDRSNIASNGDLAQVVSFGANARIANSGENVHLVTSGDNAVIASTVSSRAARGDSRDLMPHLPGHPPARGQNALPTASHRRTRQPARAGSALRGQTASPARAAYSSVGSFRHDYRGRSR